MSSYPALSALLDGARRLLEENQPRQAWALLAKVDRVGLSPTSSKLVDLLGRRIDQAIERSGGQAGFVKSPFAPSLLQGDSEAPLPGISIVSACMNRESNLLRALPSWLDSPVDEIIIVDWSSRRPLWPVLERWNDPRLHVVRIDDEPNWILTHAFNVGLRLARHERVYKLDADIVLSPEFFTANSFDRGEFVRGFWRAAVDAGQDDQRYVNGSFGAFKDDLRAVGYYDERIRTYGWDDSDLYRRLAGSHGLAGRLLTFGSLQHLPQDEGQRTENQDIADDFFLGHISATEHENQVNRFHVSTLPDWGAQSPSNDFSFHVLDARFAQGQRSSPLVPGVRSDRELGRVLAARTLASWSYRQLGALDWSVVCGLEFASLLAQLHAVGLSHAFAQAVSQKKGVQLFRPERALQAACIHTIDVLNTHRSSGTGPLAIVEDSSTQGQPCTAPRAVFLARPGVMAELERHLQPRAHADLAELEFALNDPGSACGLWTVDARFLADSARRTVDRLLGRFPAGSLSPDRQACGTHAVSSIYDESNLLRLNEYLACLILNARAFGQITLYYESHSGLFIQALQQLVSDGVLPVCAVNLLAFDGRPTFEQLFAAQRLCRPGTLLVVMNADVFVDDTLAELAQALPDDVVCALSRRDLGTMSPSEAPLIRLENGCPNTLSADVWACRTPFEPDFHLDYPIGSFHCDSFINHQFSRSQRYRPANPCLDVHVFHLHDERFNSSQAKWVRDRDLIEQRHDQEKKRHDGADPLRGLPWMRLRDIDVLARRELLTHWRPRGLVIDRSASAVSFADLVLAHVLCLAMRACWDVAVVLRVAQDELDSPVTRLASLMKSRYGHGALMFDVAPAPALLSIPGVRHTLLDVQMLGLRLAEGGLPGVESWLQEAIPAVQPGVDPHQVCGTFARSLDESGTQALWHSLQQRQPVEAQALVDWLQGLAAWTPEWKLVRPISADLKAAARMPRAPGTRPTVCFVTSMFQGGEFVPGYLANVLAAAVEADGEVVLVDANCSDADAPAVETFLREHAEARRRIQWLRLDHDPGLYACWRLGIEQSRADFITNANLDDRRSPGHTRLLVQALQAHPSLVAASGCISAVRDRAEGSWFDLLPNELWFEDVPPGEFGHGDLYIVDSDGTVRSRNVLHCMPVWRRDLHREFGYFDEDRYGTSADWAFWLAVSRAGRRFAFVPEAYGRYLVNLASHNRRHDSDGAKERRIISELIGVDQERVLKQ